MWRQPSPATVQLKRDFLVHRCLKRATTKQIHTPTFHLGTHRANQILLQRSRSQKQAASTRGRSQWRTEGAAVENDFLCNRAVITPPPPLFRQISAFSRSPLPPQIFSVRTPVEETPKKFTKSCHTLTLKTFRRFHSDAIH